MTRNPAARSRAGSCQAGGFLTQCASLRNQRGSQLVEFAFILPFLAVMTVGVIDFAQGFLLKQKLTNAAREGARIAVELSPVDIDQDDPATVRSVRNAVVNYMDNADLDVTGIDSAPTSTGPAEWTFYDGGAVALIVCPPPPPPAPPPDPPGCPVIVINRGVVIPSASGSIGSRVTVRYPFTWSFSDVIQLMVPSATFPGSFLISTDVTMKNLVN